MRLGVTVFAPWTEHGDGPVFPAFTFSPGVRIVQGSDFALVASLPLSVGIAFAEMDYSYLGIDVPAMLEFHFGSATGNTNKTAGFMLGAGAGYQYAGETYNPYMVGYDDYDYWDTATVHQLDFWGYRLQAGVTFGKEREGQYGDRSMILLQYGRSLASDKKYTIGVGFYMSVGNRRVPTSPKQPE